MSLLLLFSSLISLTSHAILLLSPFLYYTIKMRIHCYVCIYVTYTHIHIGMWGIVKYRQNAKQNWQERQDYEDRIRQRTQEIKAVRLAGYYSAAEKQQPGK